jgi:hypothetical protein
MPDDKPTTWSSVAQECVRCAVITGCLVALVFFSAQNPSQDDAVRGAVTGFAGYLLAVFNRRLG